MTEPNSQPIFLVVHQHLVRLAKPCASGRAFQE